MLAALTLGAPAQAQGWTLLKAHAGTERRENLDWYGVTAGRYTGSWPEKGSLPAGGSLRRFINREPVHVGIDFTLAAIDDDRFTETRYDVSLVPKLRYYAGEHWYWSAGLGIAYNELEDESSDEVDLRLGSKLFFAPEASLGIDFDIGGSPLFAELLYTHRSNAGFGDRNQSVNFFMLALGTRIGGPGER